MVPWPVSSARSTAAVPPPAPPRGAWAVPRVPLASRAARGCVAGASPRYPRRPWERPSPGLKRDIMTGCERYCAKNVCMYCVCVCACACACGRVGVRMYIDMRACVCFFLLCFCS